MLTKVSFDFHAAFWEWISATGSGDESGTEDWDSMTIEALPRDPDVWMKALARRLELYESLKADEVGKRFSVLADRIVQAFENSGKILLFGNGGSATDAQHAAAEWVGRFMYAAPTPAGSSVDGRLFDSDSNRK